jgi:hypothetical protein
MQPIMKKFLALGTECVEFRAAADEAKSKQHDALITQILHTCQTLTLHILEHETSLGNALCRVKGLEAKLTSNTKALEEAQAQLAVVETRHKEELAAAKNAASQAVKEAEARAIKAEDALAKSTQEQSQREETAIARLNALSVAFGSKYLLTYDFFCSILYLRANPNVPCYSRTNWGSFLAACRAEDSLFDAVEVVESNCKNARMVLQHSHHALTRLFGIWRNRQN